MQICLYKHTSSSRRTAISPLSMTPLCATHWPHVMAYVIYKYVLFLPPLPSDPALRWRGDCFFRQPLSSWYVPLCTHRQ